MRYSKDPHWAYRYKDDPDTPSCGWPLAIVGGALVGFLFVATMWLAYWAGF